MITSTCPEHRNRNGFSLIEVLVSLLILAIGVLGIIALQFKGLKYNNDASLRSQITFLANDITDRVRLNQANAAAYVSSYVAGTSHPPCVFNAGVNAVNDLNCWHDMIDTALPPGSTANISGPVAGLYTASLGWTDREGETRIISYSFQPD